MSEDGKLPEIAPQASEPNEAQPAVGGNQRNLDSANSFNNNRASRSQPGPGGGGKTAFIAKKERQE